MTDNTVQTDDTTQTTPKPRKGKTICFVASEATLADIESLRPHAGDEGKEPSVSLIIRYALAYAAGKHHPEGAE